MELNLFYIWLSGWLTLSVVFISLVTILRKSDFFIEPESVQEFFKGQSLWVLIGWFFLLAFWPFWFPTALVVLIAMSLLAIGK